jgi:hypothetical protein
MPAAPETGTVSRPRFNWPIQRREVMPRFCAPNPPSATQKARPRADLPSATRLLLPVWFPAPMLKHCAERYPQRRSLTLPGQASRLVSRTRQRTLFSLS